MSTEDSYLKAFECLPIHSLEFERNRVEDKIFELSFKLSILDRVIQLKTMEAQNEQLIQD